jgi:hypothetical protein
MSQNLLLSHLGNDAAVAQLLSGLIQAVNELKTALPQAPPIMAAGTLNEKKCVDNS